MKVEKTTHRVYKTTQHLLRCALQQYLGLRAEETKIRIQGVNDATWGPCVQLSRAHDKLEIEIVTIEKEEREQVELNTTIVKEAPLTSRDITAVLRSGGAKSVGSIAKTLGRTSSQVYEMLNAHAGYYWHRIHATFGEGENDHIDLWVESIEDLG